MTDPRHQNCSKAHYALSGLPYKAQIFIHTLNCYLGECEAAVWIYTSAFLEQFTLPPKCNRQFLTLHLFASVCEEWHRIHRAAIPYIRATSRPRNLQMCLLLEPLTQNTLKVEEIKSRCPQKLWTIILDQITNPSQPWSYRPDPRVCRQ